MTSPVLRISAVLGLTLGLAALAPRAAAADPPSVTPADVEADRAVLRGQRAGRRLLSLLGERRAIGDEARARCLDDKLTQVNAFSRTILARRARLRQAEQAGDRVRANHERLVIRRLAAQLADVEAEGRACVMPRHQSDGRTVVTMIVDPRAPRIFR